MNFTDLALIKEHPSYVFKDKITEICKPLFENFPISYFNYMYKYQDGTLGALITNGDWMDYYLQRDYPLLINGQKIHPWTVNIPLCALDDAAVQFNLYNGILSEKAHKDCIEVLEFASPNPSSSPIEFCCNKNLLNQFFLYFKSKARDLIKVIEKEPLCLSKEKFSNIKDSNPLPPSYLEFIQSVRTNKVHFKLKSKDIFFSRREYEVLYLLASGSSTKEAAAILKLSPRTIESYLYRAKNKTNQLTTNQLLEVFRANLF